MRQLLSVLLISIIAFSSSRAQEIKNLKSLTKLEGDIEKIMENANCQGMAVAVIKHGQIAYAKGFGYRNVEEKLPVTPQTLFAIGSCTKSFTAALVGQLEDQGQVNLDRPAIDYHPLLRFKTDEMNRMVSLRDMMSHTTGLPRHDMSWHFFPSASRDSMIQRISYMEPNAQVRLSYQYNNFMYVASGGIVEQQTGTSWEQNVSSKLFAPLQMNESVTTTEQVRNASNAALGYTSTASNPAALLDYADIGGMGPAGAIYSNVLEMSNWVEAWLNDGKFNGTQVIPAQFVQEATSTQVALGRLPRKQTPDLHADGYGFGWVTSSYRGHYRINHGGNIDGFTANVAFFPTDGIGIVVLTNQNHSILPNIVRNMMADELLGLKERPWGARFMKPTPKKSSESTGTEKVSSLVKGTQPSHSMAGYTGKYHNAGYGTFNIVNRNDTLLVHTPEQVYWLKHFHYDVFELIALENGKIDTNKISSEPPFNFQTNHVGDIVSLSLDLQESTGPLYFDRQQETLTVNEDDLQRFVGKYDMGGPVIEIRLLEGKLKMTVPRQPEYTLNPVEDLSFTVEELDGFKVEFEEGLGTISALVLVQPNGSFKVPRKQ